MRVPNPRIVSILPAVDDGRPCEALEVRSAPGVDALTAGLMGELLFELHHDVALAAGLGRDEAGKTLECFPPSRPAYAKLVRARALGFGPRVLDSMGFDLRVSSQWVGLVGPDAVRRLFSVERIAVGRGEPFPLLVRPAPGLQCSIDPVVDPPLGRRDLEVGREARIGRDLGNGPERDRETRGASS